MCGVIWARSINMRAQSISFAVLLPSWHHFGSSSMVHAGTSSLLFLARPLVTEWLWRLREAPRISCGHTGGRVPIGASREDHETSNSAAWGSMGSNGGAMQLQRSRNRYSNAPNAPHGSPQNPIGPPCASRGATGRDTHRRRHKDFPTKVYLICDLKHSSWYQQINVNNRCYYYYYYYYTYTYTYYYY